MQAYLIMHYTIRWLRKAISLQYDKFYSKRLERYACTSVVVTCCDHVEMGDAYN